MSSPPSLIDSAFGSTGSRKSVLASATQTIDRTVRKNRSILIALSSILLVLSALWVGKVVRDSVRSITRESLRSILAANVSALQLWLSEQESYVGAAARDPEIREAALALVEASSQNGSWNAGQMKSNEHFASIEARIRAESFLGWAIVDSRNRVIACSIDELIGHELDFPSDAMKRIRSQGPTVCRPFRCPFVLAAEGPSSVPDSPVMAAMAPVDEKSTGVLVLLISPLDRFSELLSIARTGGSGETYAFDRDAVMLTQSRFEDQLRRVGLLDADPRHSSPLNVSIRDPGINLLDGKPASLPRPQQPLTRMADEATRGATGSNVSGYNDYRGVPVVGAWTWLPNYGFGVTTEINVDEAFRPVRLLETWLFALLALLAGLGISTMLLSTFLPRWIRRTNGRDRGARELGKYRLGELIGRGGMGAVYHGTHHMLKRDVAIKVLETQDASEQSIARFEREVQMTAQLRHPNTIDLYDYGHSDNGAFFYVMEYVEGISLQSLIDHYGAQPPARVIHLLQQICGSLSEAHQMGLIHRDIKPANLLLSTQAGIYDLIKVLDFGLVKYLSGQSSDMSLTQSDGITGTPMYMSPESVRDASISDVRSDLYSVAAVGYALLTGLPIFDAQTSVDVCLKQLNEMPKRPNERVEISFPDDLQNVLMSCLVKDPDLRPPSINEFAEALKQCGDAGTWEMSDALRWWEVVFDGRVSSGNSTDPNKTHVGASGTDAGTVH